MSHHVISLNDITKMYDGFQLGPIDLEIETGYVVAVVGPNGSGKSTLFRILMNLVQAERGDVRLFGLRHDEHEVNIKDRIGYVPERSRGHDHMSARQLGAFHARWYSGWNAGRYDSAIQEMGVDRDKAFGKLSKGMQRRVVFALAMATGPDLLLCDELTDGVDPFARRDLLADIARFMEEGERTVLFATHNMDEVRRIADYVVFLVNGAFRGMYEKDALLDDWRRLWLDRPPNPGTPGMVRVRSEDVVEVVSSQWRETASALEAQGVVVERTAPLDLTDILEQLMEGAAVPLGGEEKPLVRTW